VSADWEALEREAGLVADGEPAEDLRWDAGVGVRPPAGAPVRRAGARGSLGRLLPAAAAGGLVGLLVASALRLAGGEAGPAAPPHAQATAIGQLAPTPAISEPAPEPVRRRPAARGRATPPSEAPAPHVITPRVGTVPAPMASPSSQAAVEFGFER
jgi:hypothetical protein